MSPGMSQAPTITTPAMTQAGMILGTAAYMSPEQARGRPVDKRADIWAFGCVLYEMLTAKRAFPGEDITDTLAAVVKLDPRWDAVSADVPSRVLQAIRVCLRKDPQQRVRDIHAVRLALEGAFETGVSQAAEPVAVSQPAVWRRPVSLALTASLLTAAVIGLAVWSLWPSTEPRTVARFGYVLPESLTGGLFQLVAVSPDGRHFVYQTSTGFHLRTMGELDARLIPGTEGAAANPFLLARRGISRLSRCPWRVATHRDHGRSTRGHRRRARNRRFLRGKLGGG